MERDSFDHNNVGGIPLAFRGRLPLVFAAVATIAVSKPAIFPDTASAEQQCIDIPIGGPICFEIPTAQPPAETSPAPSPAPTPEQPIEPTQPVLPPSHTSPKPKSKKHTSHNQTKPGRLSYYQNPFGQVNNLRPLRIDMGVDYAGSGNVHAIGKGRIIAVKRGTSVFWAAEKGNAVTYQLSEGPAGGRNVFVSENCTPNSKLYVGKKVTAASVICHMHNSSPFIEMGWATESKDPNKRDRPAAWAHQYVPSGNPDGTKTRYGHNFNQFMVALGVPSGNSHPDHRSVNPQRIVGKLPKGFPIWK